MAFRKIKGSGRALLYTALNRRFSQGMVLRPTALYRFRLEVTDVDRSFYGSLDFRVAMHPSEALPYLVTRILARALSHEEGLEFCPEGLSDPDLPALRVAANEGGFKNWIEIGSPSARKLHKAAKSSKRVQVYTYKNPELLLKEIAGGTIYHAEKLDIFSFEPKFLEAIGEKIERDNAWNVLRNDGSIHVSGPGFELTGEINAHPVSVV